jgi:hypothetical protein
MGWLDPRTWCWSLLLRHPLFTALVQLLVGILIAYLLTERWQRWRQRREFQHRTLVKFSELSNEMMDLLSELLIRRGHMRTEAWVEKQREFISRWTAFTAIRGEMMGAFGRQFILSADYQGVFNALTKLRSYVGAPAPVPQQQFEPEQEKFLANREAVVASMLRSMKLLQRKDWESELQQARRGWRRRIPPVRADHQSLGIALGMMRFISF